MFALINRMVVAVTTSNKGYKLEVSHPQCEQVCFTRVQFLVEDSHGKLATSHVTYSLNHLLQTWISSELLHASAPELSTRQSLLHPGQLSPAYIASGISPAISDRELRVACNSLESAT